MKVASAGPVARSRSLGAMLIAAFALPGVAFSQTPAGSSQPAADSTVRLEKFEVTGSRVKRLDVETPAPVVAYSAADIENKGYTNIGDFIQSLPFNSGAANSIYQTASFTRGAATTNLRGLGAQRFLVLLNGRRPVTYALTTSGNNSVFDFNSLPASAIETVEFLKDGASAIYGADAVTGVLNVKLKKNYTGMSVMGMYGNTLGHDSGFTQANVVAGASTGSTRAMVAVDYKSSNSNFLRDYGITNTDYTQLFPGDPNKGANQNSSLNFPANIQITAAQAAAISAALGVPFTAGNYGITGGQPVANPTLGSFSNIGTIGNANRYNFAETYQRYPAYHYLSAYAQFEHDISETLTAFGEMTFNDNFTFYAFTPGVINFATEGLTLPANSPYNPFGVALNTLLARTNFGPVRKFDTESVGMNIVSGLRGTIADRWDWEVAGNYGFNRVTTVARNAVRATTYQAALNGTLAGFVGSFFNPFGPSANPGLANALFTTSTSSNRSEAMTFDGRFSGTLFELPGGDVGMAAGFEFRNTVLTTNPDTAAYLGSGGGQPLQGERDVISGYVELTAPILKDLEVQAAVRYEDYSDFGNTTKPKIGAKYRLPKTPFGNALLRASYSESFQAPALGLLYASQTISFTQGLLQDPLRPQDPPQQMRLVAGGNPNLLPEESESYYAGIVVEDVGGIRDLTFNVDYFHFRIDQVIVTPTANFLLTPAGIAAFPNAIIRDGPGGPIVRIEAVPSNNPNAYQKYRGMDIGVNYRLRNTRLGDFTFAVDATRLLEIGNDNGLGGGYQNRTGLWFNPKWRANASVGWRQKDWSAAVSSDYMGSFYNDGWTVAGWPESSYTLVHANVSYRGFMGSTITLGANNLFDNLPPLMGRDTSGFDPNVYSGGALGRFVYLRVRKDF